MRVICAINAVRWVVIAALFAGAFYVDGTCVPPPGQPDYCTENLLAIGTLLLTVTVVAEVAGHRLVRRNLQGVMDDPPEPAPPIPLRVVRDDEDEDGSDGNDRGPLAPDGRR